MTVVPSRPTVDNTTARLIATNPLDSASASASGLGDQATLSFWLQNVTATALIYLGGDSSVTAATGVQWDGTKGPLSIGLEPGESLYGIVASGQPTQTIHALKSGR